MKYILIFCLLFTGAIAAQDLGFNHLQNIHSGGEAEADEILTELGWQRDGDKKSWFYGEKKAHAMTWCDIKSGPEGEYVLYMTNQNSTYVAIKDKVKEEGSLFKSKMKSPNYFYAYKTDNYGAIFVMRKQSGTKVGSYAIYYSGLDGMESLWEQVKNQ